MGNLPTAGEPSASQRVVARRIRVVICDPVSLVRQGMRRVLGGHRDIVIVGEGQSSQQAVELAVQHLPDAVLMGVHQIDGGTLDAVARVGHEAPSCRAAILVDKASVSDLLKAAAVGASGLLLKRSSVPRLAEAMRTMVAGGWPLDPGLIRDLLQELTAGGRPGPALLHPSLRPEMREVLSPREHEVLLSLLRGRRNREIGEALGMSTGTVKTHLRHIFHKLNVPDRTAAVLLALEVRVERAP